MNKIVGLGACVVDTLISCESFPREDTKYKASEITKVCGGPVANALVVASHLGAEASVIGAVSDDDGGKFIISDFKSQGVNTDGTVAVGNTRSFVSFVILSKTSGTRTCIFERGSVPDNAQNVCLSAIDGAHVLHLDGNYLTSAIHAAKYAKSVGVKVSLDAGGLYPGIEELLPLVDILIPSAEFAMGITKTDSPRDAIIALYEKYSPEVLVVTDGERGGYYVKDGEVHTYAPFKIQPIDTNGAGDTFHGAFITAYTDGMGLEECCRFASAASAYKCMHKGIRGYAFDRNTVCDFILKYS